MGQIIFKQKIIFKRLIVTDILQLQIFLEKKQGTHCTMTNPTNRFGSLYNTHKFTGWVTFWLLVELQVPVCVPSTTPFSLAGVCGVCGGPPYNCMHNKESKHVHLLSVWTEIGFWSFCWTKKKKKCTERAHPHTQRLQTNQFPSVAKSGCISSPGVPVDRILAGCSHGGAHTPPHSPTHCSNTADHRSGAYRWCLEDTNVEEVINC